MLKTLTIAELINFKTYLRETTLYQKQIKFMQRKRFLLMKNTCKSILKKVPEYYIIIGE